MPRPRKPVRHDPALAEVPREGEEPLFSRPSEAGPFGKADERIDLSISGEFKTRHARVARLKGHASAAGYAREVLEHQLLLDEEEIDRIVALTGGNSQWRNSR